MSGWKIESTFRLHHIFFVSHTPCPWTAKSLSKVGVVPLKEIWGLLPDVVEIVAEQVQITDGRQVQLVSVRPLFLSFLQSHTETKGDQSSKWVMQVREKFSCLLAAGSKSAKFEQWHEEEK